MAQVRTFVAIDCSAKLRAACELAVRQLSDVVDGARWVRPENIHLTLMFLGEVEDRELNRVCQRVQTAVSGVKQFGVTCRSIGAFPSNEKPNTIWVDVVDPDGAVVQLQSKLALELVELGFPIERRPFRPHLTLGRTRSRQSQCPEWQQAVERYKHHDFGPIAVKEVVVYSSELERREPLYTALARCPLG